MGSASNRAFSTTFCPALGFSTRLRGWEGYLRSRVPLPPFHRRSGRHQGRRRAGFQSGERSPLPFRLEADSARCRCRASHSSLLYLWVSEACSIKKKRNRQDQLTLSEKYTINRAARLLPISRVRCLAVPVTDATSTELRARRQHLRICTLSTQAPHYDGVTRA